MRIELIGGGQPEVETGGMARQHIGELHDGQQSGLSSQSACFEGVLVVEARMDRYWVDGETVHHSYGARDDNRLEKPKLWTKPRPTGVCVKEALV